jgi:predicted permease
VGQILETLAPLALLIALGSGLAHIRFLGATFISDLNKLAFWVALPALIFTSADQEAEAGVQIWRLFGVMVVATFLISLIAWGVSFALRMPEKTRGTLVQAAFRGNLAYIGIPVMANSFQALPPAEGRTAMTTMILVVVLTMALYNILAVIVLQLSQHSLGAMHWGQLGRSIGTNPLLLSGILGLVAPLVHLRLPGVLEQALLLLGAAAIPLSLLCIGGALVVVPLRGKFSWIFVGALMKTALVPLLVWALACLAGLDPLEERIALVLSACPTAAAAFVMARQMGGDEALASGSIALSTLFSAVSLSAALWLGNSLGK